MIIRFPKSACSETTTVIYCYAAIGSLMINSFDVSVLNMKMACTQLTLPFLFNLQWTKNTLVLWISRWSG